MSPGKKAEFDKFKEKYGLSDYKIFLNGQTIVFAIKEWLHVYSPKHGYNECRCMETLTKHIDRMSIFSWPTFILHEDANHKISFKSWDDCKSYLLIKKIAGI